MGHDSRMQGQLPLITERTLGLRLGTAWIVLPDSMAALAPAPLSHVPTTVMLRLSDGTLWMLRAQGQLWTVARIEHAAAILAEHAECAAGRHLMQRLRDALELPSLSIEAPILAGDLGKQWGVRAVAIQLLMRNLSFKRAVTGTYEGLSHALEVLEATLNEDLRKAIDRLVAALDLEVLTIATGDGFAHEIYNYLARQPTRRNRLQVAEALPIFVWSLANEGDMPAMAALRRAIDNGQPLVDTISRLFEVSPATVRSVIGRSPSMIGSRWLQQPRGLLRVLDRMSPELRPKADPAAWERFNRAADAAERLFGRPPWVGVLTASWMKHSMQEGMAAQRARSHLAALDADSVRAIEEFRLALIAAIGAELRESAVDASASLEQSATLEVDRHIESLSLRRLAEMSCKWRRDAAIERAGLQRELDLASGRTYWPLVPRPFEATSARRRVVPLTNLHALKAQGEALWLCLAASQLHSYDAKCRKGEAFIVSIVDSDSGIPMSTVEFHVPLRWSGHGGGVQVVQHRAKRNAPPSLACSASLNELVAHLETTAARRHLQVGLYTITSLARRANTCVDDFELAARVAAFRKAMGGQQYEELARRAAHRSSTKGAAGVLGGSPRTHWRRLRISDLLEKLTQ